MPKAVRLPKGREFTFKSGGGQTSKYPWNEWFNGDLLMLERTTTDPDGKKHVRDYDVSTSVMPAKLKTAARRRYKVLQISRVDADGNKLVDSLIIKGRPMTQEERLVEDLKRAEEKAARQTSASEYGDTTDRVTPIAGTA